jgi:hypothetical protein
MLELVRKNAQLYIKVLMNISLPIHYENKVFNERGDKVKLLLEDEVMFILARNGNIKCWTGEKFIKLNLGQFYDVMQKKNYKVVDYVEPKQQPPKVEVKKEEPKIEPKVEVKKEEPKQQVSEIKEVVKEEIKQNDNKKQRHNNNNKQQGGDK